MRHPVRPLLDETTQPRDAYGVAFGMELFTSFHMSVTSGPMKPMAAMAPITSRPHTKPHSKVSVPRSSRRKDDTRRTNLLMVLLPLFQSHSVRPSCLKN